MTSTIDEKAVDQMRKQLAEVAPFIAEPKAIGRVLPALLQYTASTEGCVAIKGSGCLRVLLEMLLTPSRLPGEHCGSALSILINLSAVSELFTPAIISDDLLVSLVSNLLLPSQGRGAVAGLVLILLSNLTSSPPLAHRFVAAQADAALLKCVVRLAVSPEASSCWLHQLLANLTQSDVTRAFLLEDPPARLAPYFRLLRHSDLVTRRAAAQICRNSLFENRHIDRLLNLSFGPSPSSPMSSSSTSSTTADASSPSLLLSSLVDQIGAEQDPGVLLLLLESLSLAALNDGTRALLNGPLYSGPVAALLSSRQADDITEWRLNAINRFAMSLAGDLNSPTQDGIFIRADQVSDDGDDDVDDCEQS